MPQPALLPLSKRVSSLNGHKVMILTSHVVVAFSFRVLFCQHNLYHYSVLPLSGFSLHHPLLLGGYSVLFFHGQIVCSWPTIRSPGEILQSVNSRVYPLHVDLSIVTGFVAPLVAIHTFSCGSTIYLLEGFGSQFS